MALKIVSWNVNSLRSAIRKDFVSWLEKANPDIVCLQEIRATLEQLRPLEALLKGYRAIWHPALRPGYAGTAILSKFEPIDFETGLNGEPDPEGRALTLDFGKFRVASLYAPNAIPGTHKIAEKCTWLNRLQDHVAANSDKPIILGGDLNVAQCKLDSRNELHPSNVNGCTAEERSNFQKILHACNLYDPVRDREPGSILSTWWHAMAGERQNNNGIRFDYILLNDDHRDRVLDCAIHSEIDGSDHCPTSLTINFPTEDLRPAVPAALQPRLL